nr:MFS transporter, metabolite:H+ symporter (MHS) family protein [Klebsiella pneumoniae]
MKNPAVAKARCAIRSSTTGGSADRRRPESGGDRPFYIFSTFVVSYATTTLSYQKSQALESVTLGALVATVMIPLMGLLSDKVGRQRCTP